MTEADFEKFVCDTWRVASKMEKDIYSIKNDRYLVSDINKILQDNESIKNKLLELKVKLQK